jgi:hypothetical protein
VGDTREQLEGRYNLPGQRSELNFRFRFDIIVITYQWWPWVGRFILVFIKSGANFKATSTYLGLKRKLTGQFF